MRPYVFSKGKKFNIQCQHIFFLSTLAVEMFGEVISGQSISGAKEAWPMGLKYYWSQSIPWAEVCLGPKYMWGQTGCEPFALHLVKIGSQISQNIPFVILQRNIICGRKHFWLGPKQWCNKIPFMNNGGNHATLCWQLQLYLLSKAQL